MAIVQKEKSGRRGWMLPQGLALRLFGPKRKAFYRRLQIMAKARMPFDAAITELRQQAFANKQGVMYAMLDSVEKRMRRGRSLDESLDGWLPKEDRMLLAAGDKQGYAGFVAAIDQILAVQDASKEMRRTLISGLTEPLVMILAMYGLIAWMSKNFNEKALTVTHIDPHQLTGLAHQLYAVGLFAVSPWAWISPLLALAFIAFLFMTMPVFTQPKALRMALDNVPPWSIYRAMTGAKWLLTFATLGRAHLPYEVIFKETASLAGPWLKERIDAISRQYARGFNLGESFKRAGYDFPSKSLVDDLVAFGGRPGFEEVLYIMAQEWIVETTRFVKAITTTLTGMGYMLVFVGMFWIMGAFNAMQNQITAIIQQIH